MSLLAQIDSPYTKTEAWFYDTVIAPAVLELKSKVRPNFLSKIPKGGRLLDVGCGGGHTALYVVRERPDLKITGVDLSTDQIGRARHRVEALNGHVKFFTASALDLPFHSHEFDAVYSIASVKHWKNRLKGLSECVRVLKPGRELFIIELDRGCTLKDAKAFVQMWHMPRLLDLLALPLFRTFAAGQSLDLEEGRSLMSRLNLEKWEVRRIPETPALLMTGRKKRK